MAVAVGGCSPTPDFSRSYKTAAPASQRVSKGATLLLRLIAALAIRFCNVWLQHCIILIKATRSRPVWDLSPIAGNQLELLCLIFHAGGSRAEFFPPLASNRSQFRISRHPEVDFPPRLAERTNFDVFSVLYVSIKVELCYWSNLSY